MFDVKRPNGQNTANIGLDDDDQFDKLITPAVAADLAHYLRQMPDHIQRVIGRLSTGAP